MIQKAIPILTTLNLKATIDFFENNLGFKATNIGSCIILKNGNAEIQLNLIPNKNKSISFTGSCCLYVTNIEDLYSQLSSKDLILPQGAIRQTIFGFREFHVKDNNDNIIYFREQK